MTFGRRIELLARKGTSFSFLMEKVERMLIKILTKSLHLCQVITPKL